MFLRIASFSAVPGFGLQKFKASFTICIVHIDIICASNLLWPDYNIHQRAQHHLDQKRLLELQDHGKAAWHEHARPRSCLLHCSGAGWRDGPVWLSSVLVEAGTASERLLMAFCKQHMHPMPGRLMQCRHCLGSNSLNGLS